MQTAPIYFAQSDRHGRGVFAGCNFAPGDIIEICPVLLFQKEQLPQIRATMLDDYYFNWGDDGEWYAFALGYGSLYNHSYEPNAEYGMDFDSETIDFYCIKPITSGEEILINYNGDVDDKSTVWFEK